MCTQDRCRLYPPRAGEQTGTCPFNSHMLHGTQVAPLEQFSTELKHMSCRWCLEPQDVGQSEGLVVSSLASFQDRSVTATPCHYTGPVRTGAQRSPLPPETEPWYSSIWDRGQKDEGTTRPLLSSSSPMIHPFSKTLKTVDTVTCCVWMCLPELMLLVLGREDLRS